MSEEENSVPQTRDIVIPVFSSLRELAKLTNEIPVDDYDYHLAFPAFRKTLRDNGDILVDVMDQCCRLLPKRRRVSLEGCGRDASGVALLDEGQRTGVMEAIDSFLENVDATLDELRGRRLHAGDQLTVEFGSQQGGGGEAPGFGSASAVVRPQLSFAVPVDNSPEPFVPHYADVNGVLHVGTAGVHPFEAEIRAFSVPSEQLLPRPETPFLPLAGCPLRFVDTEEGLAALCDELAAAREIAVDLEHHDYYSFQGFTCLMQISTREEDIIVDCLKLRACMHRLAPVFLNPGILKVFHGAREDVRWLQKDFGLYLVNFFDTGLALQALHMPYSLAFAADHFCQVKLNKTYQTADWRTRPLPAAMVHYARQDTHYLLYIYDRLKSLLLNSEARASVGNLLVHVYKESAQLSLEQYVKPVLDPENSYKHALGRSLGGLSAVQEYVVKRLFNWRDAAAREADDSPPAVLHLASILSVASKLPTSARDLLRCCSPVSAVLRQHVAEVVQIVRDALRDMEGLDEAALADASGDHHQPQQQHQHQASDVAADMAGHRPIGVHRPMTGTLPSITSLAYAAPEERGASSLVLSAAEPSLWFRTMQSQSLALSRRAAPQVALPGVEVWELMQSQARAAAAKAEAAKAEAMEKASSSPSEDSNAGDDDSDDDNEEKDDADAEPTAGDHDTDETGHLLPGFVSVEKIPTAGGARSSKMQSLKQMYGTGAQNRKRAKRSEAKKRGKK